jgi:hypothetical protein
VRRVMQDEQRSVRAPQRGRKHARRCALPILARAAQAARARGVVRRSGRWIGLAVQSLSHLPTVLGMRASFCNFLVLPIGTGRKHTGSSYGCGACRAKDPVGAPQI